MIGLAVVMVGDGGRRACLVYGVRTKSNVRLRSIDKLKPSIVGASDIVSKLNDSYAAIVVSKAFSRSMVVLLTRLCTRTVQLMSTVAISSKLNRSNRASGRFS